MDLFKLCCNNHINQNTHQIMVLNDIEGQKGIISVNLELMVLCLLLNFLWRIRPFWALLKFDIIKFSFKISFMFFLVFEMGQLYRPETDTLNLWCRSKAMSFTKGDLLTKTRKLVNGLAMAKPVWLKAMEKYVLCFSNPIYNFGYNLFISLVVYQTSMWHEFYRSPPAVFPRAEKKVERICLPEDVYVNKFYKKHPESLHEDPLKYICSPLNLVQ